MDILPTAGETNAAKIAEADVLDRLEKLEQALIATDPSIPVHLGSILKTLHTYEELIHLMDDAKIRVLMAGMLKHRKVELVKEAATSKSKKALGKTTVDDI